MLEASLEGQDPCLRPWHHTEHAASYTVFPTQALRRPEATNRFSDEKKDIDLTVVFLWMLTK